MLKIKDPQAYGMFLLGTGALILALTFLHLYLTKIMPEGNGDKLYVYCSTTNTSTVVQVNARDAVGDVQILIFPSNESCYLGNLKKADSDACLFNESSIIAKVTYTLAGEERKKVARCFREFLPRVD